MRGGKIAAGAAIIALSFALRAFAQEPVETTLCAASQDPVNTQGQPVHLKMTYVTDFHHFSFFMDLACKGTTVAPIRSKDADESVDRFWDFIRSRDTFILPPASLNEARKPKSSGQFEVELIGNVVWGRVEGSLDTHSDGVVEVQQVRQYRELPR